MLQPLFKSRKANDQAELYQDSFFNELRAKEFSRLDDNHQVYLDYTGGNLYGQSQLDQHFSYLERSVFGKPHSTNPSSQLSTHAVKESRQKMIDFFNAEDYYCIFRICKLIKGSDLLKIRILYNQA